MFTSVEHVWLLCVGPALEILFFVINFSVYCLSQSLTGSGLCRMFDACHIGCILARENHFRDLRMQDWEAPPQQLNPIWVHRAGSSSVRWYLRGTGSSTWGKAIKVRVCSHWGVGMKTQPVLLCAHVAQWILHRDTPPAQLMHLCPQDHCILPVSFKVSDVPFKSVF